MASSRFSFAATAGALALAAGLVVLLAFRASDLHEQNQELRQRLRYPYAGMLVPTFRTAAPDGGEIVVGEAGRHKRQVLAVLTTTCPYCLASLDAWKAIAAALDSIPGASMVGLSLDSADVTARYAREHQLPFPVIRFPDERTRRLYRAGAVPQTLVLDGEGRVLLARLGLLQPGAGVDSLLTALRTGPEELAHGTTDSLRSF